MRSSLVFRSLLFALALSVGLTPVFLTALAQGGGAVVSGPDERLVLVPHLGFPSATAAQSSGASKIRVQNAGERSTRVLLVASYAAGGPDSLPPAGVCPSCPGALAVCSTPVLPGRVAEMYADREHLAASGLPMTAELQAAALLSLNTRPASDFGPLWTGAAELLELPGDATVADVVCAELRKPRQAVECASPWALIQPFAAPPTASNALWHGLPTAPMWGEPIAAVAAVPGRTGPEVPTVTVDRYRGLPYGEVWGGLERDEDSSGEGQFHHSYFLPGVYLDTPDGMKSTLVLANPGLECAHVVVNAYRTGGSKLPEELSLTLAPGQSLHVRVGVRWPNVSTAALRVKSDRPLATAAQNVGYTTTSVHAGSAARPAAVQWAVPRAYQEWRPVPGAATAGRARSTVDRAAAPFVGNRAHPARITESSVWSEAWESNISVFNAFEAQRPITMAQYAESKPPRPLILYPFQPWQQWVFQPGFGLGYPGGPGWARYESEGPPVYVAAESLREAEDSLQWIEGWSTAAWPDDPDPPRTIALADLGGPAAARPVSSTAPAKRPLSLGDRGDSSLEAGVFRVAASSGTRLDPSGPDDLGQSDLPMVGRVAIQNLGPTAAEVALDVYGQACGYAGSLNQTIDPFQTVTTLVADLPGVGAGADSALVRVLGGKVAVMVETARAGLQPVKAAGPDLASAYLGTPIRMSLVAPTLPEARLGVSTLAYTVTLPQRAPATINVEDSANSGRCLTFDASTDVPWLKLSPANGDIPGLFTFTVDSDRLGEGTEHHGRLIVRAREPNVADSPRIIPVTVLGKRTGRARVFLPSLQRGPLE